MIREQEWGEDVKLPHKSHPLEGWLPTEDFAKGEDGILLPPPSVLGTNSSHNESDVIEYNLDNRANEVVSFAEEIPQLDGFSREGQAIACAQAPTGIATNVHDGTVANRFMLLLAG